MPEGGARSFFNLVDGGLAVSAAYIAIGLLALDRGWPPGTGGATRMKKIGQSDDLVVCATYLE
jgi:hypothetical protein